MDKLVTDSPVSEFSWMIAWVGYTGKGWKGVCLTDAG